MAMTWTELDLKDLRELSTAKSREQKKQDCGNADFPEPEGSGLLFCVFSLIVSV